MKGARTEPWATMSSPPTTTTTMMIGSIHSFLRTRRKAHNSLMKALMSDSELFRERIRGGTWRIALDPVGRDGTSPQFELVPAHRAADEGDGGEQSEIDDAEDDRAHEAAQEVSKAKPRAIQRGQAMGSQEGEERTDPGSGEPPGDGRAVPGGEEAEASQGGECRRDGVAEGPVRREL